MNRLAHALAAAYLLSNLSLAAAAGCSKVTIVDLSQSVETDPEFEYNLDFLSCPASSSNGCNFTPKQYNITVQPLINITNTANAANATYQTVMNLTYTALPSADSADVAAILAAAVIDGQNNEDVYVTKPSTTITLDTFNLSTILNDPTILEVFPGTNSTLNYFLQMSEVYMAVEGCDDLTLNGEVVLIMLPTYGGANGGILNGEYQVHQDAAFTHNANGAGKGLQLGIGLAGLLT